MPMLNFYRVCYEPYLPVLVGTSLRPLNEEEVTESCELLLAKAQQHNCSFWLLDGRHHGRDDPQALHNWLLDEYFPRVRNRLGQRPYVAFVVQPLVWQGLPAKGYDHPQDWQTPAVRLGWFTEETQAQAWLARRRVQESTLRGAGIA